MSDPHIYYKHLCTICNNKPDLHSKHNRWPCVCFISPVPTKGSYTRSCALTLPWLAIIKERPASMLVFPIKCLFFTLWERISSLCPSAIWDKVFEQVLCHYTCQVLLYYRNKFKVKMDLKCSVMTMKLNWLKSKVSFAVLFTAITAWLHIQNLNVMSTTEKI